MKKYIKLGFEMLEDDGSLSEHWSRYYLASEVDARDAAMREGWQPIETAPADGRCLLAIETDGGWDFGVLERDERGTWIHEGEPTFCHGYYYCPKFWMTLPAEPVRAPVEKGGESTHPEAPTAGVWREALRKIITGVPVVKPEPSENMNPVDFGYAMGRFYAAQIARDAIIRAAPIPNDQRNPT